MLKVGLTGGIGCGKSSVSAILRELGARVIDADVLAREALGPDRPAYHEVVHAFGKRVLGSDGRIDRRALADVVFRDEQKRHLLESIVHPRVLEEEARIASEMAEGEPHSVVVFDAALLIEAGAHTRMNRVIVVSCTEETQIRRLVEGGGITEEEARLRVGAQMPTVQKIRYADYVVDNEGSMEETRRQVEEIYRELKQYV